MKKYLRIYLHIFLFSIKSRLSYRLNLLFKLMYGPAYHAVLFSVLLLVYNRTPNLAGWTRDEALLLFAVFSVIYTNCLILFMDGIRYLLWSGIRLGEVDAWLLKPGSSQFYLTLSRPNSDFIALWISVVGYFIYKLSTLHGLSLFNMIGFWIAFVLAHLIIYFILSIYATIGFVVTRAQQIIELFDKSSDFAQYPLPIFPHSLQLLLSTFLPIAYYSYIPTLFLRNQGTPQLLISCFTLTLILIFINHFAWKYALRYYSSASS